MNIDPRNTTNPVFTKNSVANQSPAQATSNKDAAAISKGGDTVNLSALDKLRAEPEVRPDVVAKGKELLNDPNWPSSEIVDSIAKLITPFDD